jgi:hypothetical protein
MGLETSVTSLSQGSVCGVWALTAEGGEGCPALRRVQTCCVFLLAAGANARRCSEETGRETEREGRREEERISQGERETDKHNRQTK